MKTSVLSLTAILISVIIVSCGGNSNSTEAEPTAEPIEIYKPKTKPNPLGVGPIQEELNLGEIDQQMAAEGEAVFTQMCTACHKMDKRHVGPALEDVVTRRNPTWIMNMILNPEGMVKDDPIAKDLLAEYLSPMANQNLTKDQARSVLEYFRKYDNENQKP